MEQERLKQDMKFDSTTEGQNLLDAYTWFGDQDVINSMVNAVIEVVKSRDTNEALKILGIGVGTAKLETAIKDGLQDKGFKIDIFVSDRLIEPLMKISDEELMRFTANNRNIPFDDECVDIVIARSVTHYEPTLDDERTVLKEIKRILKPGGVFVDQAPTFLFDTEKKLLIEIHALLPKIMNGQTKEETKQMLEDVFDDVVESPSQTEKMLTVNKDDFIKRYLPNRDKFENEQNFETALQNFNALIPRIIEMIETIPEEQRPNVWVKENDFGWRLPFTIFNCKKK